MTAKSSLTPIKTGFQAIRALPEAFAIVREGAGRDFAFSSVALLIVGVIPAGILLCTKLIIDNLTSGSGWSKDVVQLLAVQLLLAIIGVVAQAVSDTSRSAMREKLQAHLEIKVSAHASSLDLAFFELPGNYDLFEKAKQELGYRPFLMSYGLIFSLQRFASVVGFFAAVLAFQPLLALVLAVAALPTLFAAGKSGSESFSNHDLYTPEGRRAAYIQQLLTTDQSAKEVRLYGLAPSFLDVLARQFRQLISTRLQVERSRHVRFAWAGLGGVLVEYSALGIVVWRVAAQQATIGDLTLMVGALPGVRLGLSQLLAQLGEVYENSLFFQNLLDFLAQRPTITSPASPRPLPTSTAYTIMLDNVSFAYPGADQSVFENLSLELRAGETTALVGVNGAGKTTLVKLLTRLYDPQSGRILLNGVDIREFDPITYRSILGVVLQDFTRYQLSARENVALGRVGQPDEEQRLDDAVTRANAKSLIENLPEGWNTLLGRQFHIRGQDLSGGQWQRIALARALYRNAPILLLDEPTAALDAETEANLFQDYRKLTQGRTTLLITHRFNTVRSVDRIIVLEKGKVIEDGTHFSLLARGGRYSEMYHIQADAYSS